MKKRILSGVLATAMATAMIASTVCAEPGEATTSVIYDNTNQATDPGDENDPKWAVTVPSSIVFTDEDKEIETNLTLKALNGSNIEGIDVSVTVTSKNNYVMGLNGVASDDPVAYSLLYNGTVMAGKDAQVDTLTGDGDVAEGVARMSGTATKTGLHKDELTFKVASI